MILYKNNLKNMITQKYSKIFTKSLLFLFGFLFFYSFSFGTKNEIIITNDEYHSYLQSSSEFNSADKELNSIYKKLLNLLPEHEKQNLIKEQLEWIKIRDEYAFRSGPKGSKEYIDALIKITNERIQELNKKLSEVIYMEPYNTVLKEKTLNKDSVQQNLSQKETKEKSNINNKKFLNTILLIIILIIGFWFWNKFLRRRCPNCKSTSYDFLGEEELDRWIGTKKVKESTTLPSGKSMTRIREIPTTYVEIKRYFKCHNCGYQWFEISKEEKK